jgi:hypothetical protein
MGDEDGHEKPAGPVEEHPCRSCSFSGENAAGIHASGSTRVSAPAARLLVDEAGAGDGLHGALHREQLVPSITAASPMSRSPASCTRITISAAISKQTPPAITMYSDALARPKTVRMMGPNSSARSGRPPEEAGDEREE